MAIRLLCVCALDRFGDYVADQVFFMLLADQRPSFKKYIYKKIN
jgi:hypothetical protein